MSESVTSTARVRIDSPARYGKLLASYFEQLIDATWDTESSKGTFTFSPAGVLETPGCSAATCDVIATEGVLMLSLAGTESAVENAERDLATRLLHLAHDQDFAVEFARGDGAIARFTRDNEDVSPAITKN